MKKITQWSNPAENNRIVEGSYAKEVIPLVWPLYAIFILFSIVSHNMTLQSNPAETVNYSFGKLRIQVIMSLCPPERIIFFLY